MEDRITQGEFDFDKCVTNGYLESKEGVIFTILREECPRGRIFFKTTKGSRRKQFKIISGDGHIYQLNFTDEFLFYRDGKELKHALAYNLDYMKRIKTDSRALFTRASVRIKDL
jgi:hypothetical protein